MTDPGGVIATIGLPGLRDTTRRAPTSGVVPLSMCQSTNLEMSLFHCGLYAAVGDVFGAVFGELGGFGITGGLKNQRRL